MIIRFKLWFGISVGFLAQVAAAQLVITGGVQSYNTLSGVTATLTNRCELRVTNGTSPISGCTINLNSPEAWLFLPNVRPATVSASYLSQIFINGAAAVAGSNCRVDQYAMGTVIVPHAPSFAPLQVFSGQNFLGTSAPFGLYTYYNTSAALGVMRWNISSFKLKRGYAATLAQFADGTGASKVYVAQDSDLEVGALPTNLDHQCNFVRVVPWRWTGKKGWDDVGGESALIKPLWFYDWGNGRTSSADAEYAPMQWGGGYSTGINSKQSSTHVLGFNEPDKADQANLTVAQALAFWPSFMQSGLRLGAPAVSDSGTTGTGLDWLYNFISQADALGYRVDYIPVHYYKCGSGQGETAANFRSYLQGIYQTTGRPVWVTEFNYGANWCSAAPTFDQEATSVGQFIDMLESAPFVERYSIFNWVGDNRAMITNGVLTAAGVIYRDKQSTLAYAQEVPAGGSRSLAQFAFDTNTLDSSGYANNAFALGAPTYPAGHAGQAIQFDGTNTVLQLPPTIANSASFSFAGWIYWDGGASWQRIFDFGDDQTHYLFLTPSSSSGTLRLAIRNGGSEQLVETTGLTSGVWTHVAVTLSGSSAKLYKNGVLAATFSSLTNAPSNFNPNLNYLGKSQFADPLFRGRLDAVQIADYAFTAAQIAALQTNTPPQFTTNILASGTAVQETAYSGSVAGTATDVDPGDTLTYSKAGGLAWLTVAADGTLSGTPGPTDGGTNNFTVRVTDAAGTSDFALLTILTPATKGNGIWFVDAAGNWSDPTKWTRATPANGPGLTADFSVLDIAADRTVTVDSARTIGTLKFRDAAGAQAWTIAASGGSTLTLDAGSATSPALIVGSTPTLATANNVTISAALAGTNGLTKTGWGNLTLTGASPLSGTLNIDSASGSVNEGYVRLGAANAGTNLTTINIRNNNSGSSTLQLAGGAVVPASISLSGRNTNVPAIQNISGSNVLAGPLAIGVGGGYYLLQSDAGTLNFAGGISSAVSGTRNFTFQGAGDFYLAGPLQNGSATTVNATKLDAGTLILANTNSFSGGLAVGGGAVKLNHARALENNLLNLGSAGSNGLRFGAITSATLAGLNGINDVWLTNASLAAVTLTNGNNNSSSEYAGVLRGSGGLAKIGSGTFTLDNTNTYTGATAIVGGTLRFGAATNLVASLQPILWLSFDSITGSTVTNQGKGGWNFNGTILGSGAYVTNAGRFGNALYINGTGANALTNVVKISNKVADTSASGSWTLGYWLKTTTAGAVILYQGDGGWSSSGQTTYLLNGNSGSTPGTKAGAVRWAGGFLTGTAALNDGNWHFITLVDSAGTESIYVDGNVDAVTSSMTLALAAGADEMWIGGSPDADAGAIKMTGMIDEVCLFDRALTQAQIRSIYTNAPSSGALPLGSPVSVAASATLNLAGYSQNLAALTDYNGSGGTVTNSSAVPATLTLNGNSGSNVFSGVIADSAASSAISFIKSGAATAVLAGNNNFRGPTTVNAGVLLVNGRLGTNAVTVNGGQLGGHGVLAGALFVQAGTLSPGSSVGILTVSNQVTLAASSITLMELDRATATNDQLRVTGLLNYNGTLALTNLGGTLTGGEAFQLFSATSVTSNFSALTGSPGVGLDWKFFPTNGTLKIYSTVPASLAFIISNNLLQLSWPTDRLGWVLQVQTNNLSAGLSTNWFSLPATADATEFSAPLTPENESVFYRLIYP